MNKTNSIFNSLQKTDEILAFFLQKTNLALFIFDVVEEVLEIHQKYSESIEEPLYFNDFYNADLQNSGIDENFIKDFKIYIQNFSQKKKDSAFSYLGDHLNSGLQWYSLSCLSYIDPVFSKHYIIGISQAISAEAGFEVLDKNLFTHEDDKKIILSSFRINLTKKIIEEYNRFYGTKIQMQNLPFEEASRLPGFRVFKSLKDFPFDFNLDHAFYADLDKENKQVSFERRIDFEKSHLWVEIHILFSKQKNSNDIIAYCYILDINTKKILSLLKKQHLFFEYEYLAYIELDTGNLYYTSYALGESNLKKMNFDKHRLFFLQNIVSDEDRKYAAEQIDLKKIVKALEGKAFHTFYLGFQGKDNRYERKKLTYTYINKDEHVIALSVSDVTNLYMIEEDKRKSLHNALEIAQNASSAKTEFLSRMSHELRTPLNAIMGLVVLTQQKVENNPALMENLYKINSSAHYLLSIINDVLDMSRIESGKMSMSTGLIVMKDLLAKIDAIVESQARQKGIHYSSRIDDAVYHSFLGDELKLQQVLINILGNAVKFTPSGGKVSLNIEQVFFFNTEQKRKIRLTISDTGIGIKAKFLPYIFDSFSQDSLVSLDHVGGGTGLGLAISKNLITIMGGTISVKSTEGEGTTFIIELLLPIYEESLAIKKTAFFSSENELDNIPSGEEINIIEMQEKKNLLQLDPNFYKGKRILLVDDNRMNLDVAEQLLIGRGFSIDIATNGKEALEKFEASNANFYSLILMDVRMPQMDGLEATRRIRASDHSDAKTIPIVAMTANAFAEDIKATQESGMNAHLSKPIDTDILFQTIACFISGFC